MSKKIFKKVTATRVSYCTVAVDNGVPNFVPHPDVVFGGILDSARVERLLKAKLGKNETIVITNIDAASHRYEMDLEFFILNSTVCDCASGEDPSSDENSDDFSEETDEDTEGGSSEGETAFSDADADSSSEDDIPAWGQ